MPDLHEYKIGKASDILVRELYILKTGGGLRCHR